MKLSNKTVLITGGSRGIGRSIAIKLAAEGANIMIAAKSITENAKLGGTIHSVTKEIKNQGGNAAGVQCDIRDEESIINAVNQTVNTFGSIDIVINNASAISLTGTEDTSSKQYDLMHQINVRGAFLTVQHALPYLKQSSHAHILTLSPPISLVNKWMSPHIAYTMSKYNMTMLAMAWADEFKSIPICSNALWPATTIDTAAVRNILGGDKLVKMSRKPEIVADAAYYILINRDKTNTGNAFIDEEVLFQNGITDLNVYSITPGGVLYKDLFLD